jgi:hypothetical protein
MLGLSTAVVKLYLNALDPMAGHSTTCTRKPEQRVRLSSVS